VVLLDSDVVNSALEIDGRPAPRQARPAGAP
jgi:hypothetical protein